MLQNIPHQIVQSPARLGLPNPSSPSLQNATPPKLSSSQSQVPPPRSHPSNQNQSITKTTSSSVLLPLLPPLSRAQSLLLQMASLSSRLFDVSPNRPHWVSAFRGTFPTFLSSQTPPLPPEPSSTKEILSVFTTLQTQLFEAVAELQEILDLQDSKQKVAREIRSKDSVMLAFANKLKDAERHLDILVDDYADYRRPKRSRPNNDDDDDSENSSTTTTVSTQLNLSDILSYAHRISYTTFAPPEFGAGQAPLRGALPPGPQEEQMRASQLYTFADLDVGLPKTVETKEKTFEPIVEAPPIVETVNPLANIVVPSGWKPGMPVELPRDLLAIVPPPPGWKPGDPIPLPPLGLGSLPPIPEQQQQQQQQARLTIPAQAAALLPPKGQPEPIQVRRVELDIDDDGSSDYSSSDVGSSDDED